MIARSEGSQWQGTTQQTGAAYNRRVVLDLIRQERSASRKLIGERTGLSPQAVANITSELEVLGLIVSRRVTERRTRGQPPIDFAINPKGGDAIGFSLDSHRISSALVSLVGEVLYREEEEFDTSDPDKALIMMVAMARKLMVSAADPARVWGIGIALPGPFDVPGMSFVGPTALDGWHDLKPLDRLQQALGLPVFYNTDSVAGALGEMLFGAAQSLHNFFYLHLGVGLGGTSVIERSAYRGVAGNATEVGHAPLVPGGRPCYCGADGCLERYLSLHALSEAMFGPSVPELSFEQITRLIANDSDDLRAWCDEAGPHLRSAIGLIENLYDPETVVIGGMAPRQLLEMLVAAAMPLRSSVRRCAHDRVRISDQNGDSALLGAAVLPIYELLSPRGLISEVKVVHHPAQIALSASA